MERVGVLALQGAVSEHLAMLDRAGVSGTAVRRVADLEGLAGLIIPGGESTAISRLIRQNGLYDPLRAFAARNCILGTCAGLVLCATKVSGCGGVISRAAAPLREEAGESNAPPRLEPLGLMDMAVSRNGFGRQVDSCETSLAVAGIGPDIPAVFIRAPYIEDVGPDVTVLARHAGKIVMAESSRIVVTSFHPELTDDLRIFRYFLAKMRG